jgi:type I restriction enzyme S subunit
MAGEELVGAIPDGWEYTTLGAACANGGGDIQTGPFGSQLHAADYVPVGIPSIMPQNIGDNRISEEGIARITPGDAKRLSRYLVREGDIVYSRRGDVERRALIRANEEGWLCGTGCLRVRLGSQGADPSFAAYYLGHPSVREWIVRHAHGATMPNLNTSILSACPFVVPPKPEQRAIAHILGTLDDKIELNRRRNQTLEAMARALFKDWFVDFGPIRAKMEGRDPYLPADLWQRFPDRLDDDGKPEGWRRSTIGSEVTVCGGSTPSTKEPAFWENGEHHWATPKDLSALQFPVLLDTDRKITDAGIEKISSGLLPVGTVLLSSRAPIGYLAIAEVPTAINQGFIAMKCDAILPNVFVLFWCRENMDVILGNANGSTFQEISKSNFRPIPVIVPPEPILDAFRERTALLYRHIVENERESKALAQLRDTLLPKLISGDFRIADVATFMERVEAVAT